MVFEDVDGCSAELLGSLVVSIRNCRLNIMDMSEMHNTILIYVEHSRSR